jgi:hypothetical protein
VNTKDESVGMGWRSGSRRQGGWLGWKVALGRGGGKGQEGLRGRGVAVGGGGGGEEN